MPHHQSTAELVIGLVMLGGLVGLSAWAASESHSRLDNPNDDRTIYLEQLPAKALLSGPGTFRVSIIRQSGNVHYEQIVAGDAADAIAIALATFRRAKIPAVHVRTNTERELAFGRTYHDHRGSNEGKKVGRATIVRIA